MLDIYTAIIGVADTKLFNLGLFEFDNVNSLSWATALDAENLQGLRTELNN